MKLSVLANLYGAKSLDETLSILSSLGVHTVEIGAGGYPGKAHCNPEELLADQKKFDEFVATFKKYDVEICALAAHGNALHPDKAIAAEFDKDFRNAVLLAEKLGVEVYMPPLKLCGDNGAMIGSQAYYEYLAGNVADMSLNAYATKSILGEAL